MILTMPSPTLPPSAVELAKILRESQELAQRLTKRVHRSMLWRYSTGRSIPDLERAVLLEDLTGGRLTARGWIQPAPADAEVAA